MAYFYQNGELKIGSETKSQPVKSFVKNYDGPVYLYDLDDIRMRFEAYQAAFKGLKSTIHYAMKANSNALILKKLASWGAGVDTVSAGEVRKALASGFSPEKIIFSGVAKTKKRNRFRGHQPNQANQRRIPSRTRTHHRDESRAQSCDRCRLPVKSRCESENSPLHHDGLSARISSGWMRVSSANSPSF